MARYPLLAIAGLALLLFACTTPQASDAPGSSRSNPPGLEFMNFFSKDCPEGDFAVYSSPSANGTPVCEAPRACVRDEDCAYLLIENLPTRVGHCENNLCAATCGSGVARPCR